MCARENLHVANLSHRRGCRRWVEPEVIDGLGETAGGRPRVAHDVVWSVGEAQHTCCAVVRDRHHESHTSTVGVLARCSVDGAVGPEWGGPAGGDNGSRVEHAGQCTAGCLEQLVHVGVLGEEAHVGLGQVSVGAVDAVEAGPGEFERVDHAVEQRLDRDGNVDDVGEVTGRKWKVWVHGAGVFAQGTDRQRPTALATGTRGALVVPP